MVRFVLLIESFKKVSTAMQKFAFVTVATEILNREVMQSNQLNCRWVLPSVFVPGNKQRATMKSSDLKSQNIRLLDELRMSRFQTDDQ